MNYDISSDRYRHLAGLTDREIESVMLFCDMAEHVAGKDLKKNDQQENGIFRGGVTGRDSDALLHRDTKTAKPAGAGKGGHRMRGRLKLTVEATAEKARNTAPDKELIQL